MSAVKRAIARMYRVGERLHEVRSARAFVRVLLVKDTAARAIAVDDTEIRLTDELVRRCPTDAALALILGHELAHIDLGHFDGGVALSARRPSELAADRYGLHLAIAAGYDPSSCIAGFEVVRSICLDRGDHVGAHGCARGTLFDLVAGGVDAALRTHPIVPERIRAARSHVEILRFLVDALNCLTDDARSACYTEPSARAGGAGREVHRR